MAGQASPLFSIVTPVYHPPVDVLADTIASVRAQEHTDWEWVLVDDALARPRGAPGDRGRGRATTRASAWSSAPTNGDIVAASNDAVAEARGEFLVFLDHDDLLDARRAGARWPRRSAASPRSTTSTPTRTRSARTASTSARFAKPDWSPERLRDQMYTSHLSVMRTALVREVGGFRRGLRRLAGPRPGAPSHRAGSPGRPRPAGALPLARGGRVGCRPTSTPSRTPTTPGVARCRTSSTGWESPARSRAAASRAATSSSAASTPRCASRS